MLATSGPLPRGAEHAFEFKWDGVRAIVTIAGDKVRAVSRNSLDVTGHYPELLHLPAQLGGSTLILDGELVALDPAGRTSFSLLQQRMHTRQPGPALLQRVPVLFYAFDLLRQGNSSLLRWSYQRRRHALESLEVGEGPMLIPPCFPGPGQPIAEAAALNGIEGVIAKRLDSPYEPARRSPAWIKVPHTRTQEVLIVGYKPGHGKRADRIGSLLLAAHNHRGELDYVGGVGTGFTAAMLSDLAARLAPLRRPTPAMTGRQAPRADAREALWTEPELVGEVEFRHFTPAGTMRHPSWRGLRPDKHPHEVRLAERR